MISYLVDFYWKESQKRDDINISYVRSIFPPSQSLEECMSSNHVECQYDGVTTVKETKHVDLLPDWSPRRIEWTVPQFCDYSKCT